MGYRIPFNVPPCTGREVEYMQRACEGNHKICGDGPFTKQCSAWLKERTKAAACLLTTSGTAALEMAAHLSHLQPGDEVIMPSYTFCSTADAAVLKGAVPVFVDIRPDTMNIDERKIEDAITEKTKAIFCVHYGGVACEMDTIMDIARRHHLIVVEDAAQAVMSSYKGRALGTIGNYGCFSFHETKNYSMGEGGALLLRDPDQIDEAEILREKGTNRSLFYRGQIDKYTWVSYGSSFLPSDINAAYLMAQLDIAEKINDWRLLRWAQYKKELLPLEDAGKIELPFVPKECVHNAHMFYIKTADINERQALIQALSQKGILAVFHYLPLHSSPAGLAYGRFHAEDIYTSKESERILRLPMYYGLTQEETEEVVTAIFDFYGVRRA